MPQRSRLLPDLRKLGIRLETFIRCGFVVVGGAVLIAALLYFMGREDLAAIAFAASLVAILFVMVAIWAHANNWRLQFGLCELLVAMTLISIGMGALVYAIGK